MEMDGEIFKNLQSGARGPNNLVPKSTLIQNRVTDVINTTDSYIAMKHTI